MLNTNMTHTQMTSCSTNLSKSEILNISVLHTLVTHLQPSFPFAWQPHSPKYLGIHLTADPANISWVNYVPLLNSIRQDLQRGNYLATSWLGRVNVKINVLQRVLFLFQMIPFNVPRNCFALLSSLITKYIWHRSKPRIASSILSHPKSNAGLALPDFGKYLLASVLSRILDWKHHSHSKLLVLL